MELLLKVLDKLVPIKLAEKWYLLHNFAFFRDNVGLLLDPIKELINPPYKLLLTNDITDSVVNEAIENKVNMIVSYHPIIFHPIKRINYNDRVGKVILEYNFRYF